MANETQPDAIISGPPVEEVGRQEPSHPKAADSPAMKGKKVKRVKQAQKPRDPDKVPHDALHPMNPDDGAPSHQAQAGDKTHTPSGQRFEVHSRNGKEGSCETCNAAIPLAHDGFGCRFCGYRGWPFIAKVAQPATPDVVDSGTCGHPICAECHAPG